MKHWNGYAVTGELIDTQWDVNIDGLTFEEIADQRINRYIVGCK